jgi:hypothetical protein
MSSDRQNSGPNSERLSETIPTLAPEKTESDFLAKQAREARAAIRKTVGEVGEQLERMVDPRVWAEDHPWATSGAAAVAGFVAASILVPSKEEMDLKRLAKIEKYLMPKPARSERETQEQDARKPSEKSAFKNLILHHALDLLKPIITTVLMSKLAQPYDGNHNGQPTADAEEPV